MLLEVRELMKFYGETEALRGIDFTMEEGIYGLIGPNGAGKSTTIKILLDLIKPSYGEAYIFGMNCQEKSYEIKKRIGVLHENSRFPGRVTGREFLEYVGKLKNIDLRDIERKAEDVGIEKALDRKIGEYSAGMSQRLGLAQALLGDPELVILDEPTSNLDPLGRIEFLEIIKKFNRENGTNFLICTHILSELERVCDSVIVINDGVVLDYGKIDKMMEKYCKVYYRIKSSDNEKIVERMGGEIKGDYVHVYNRYFLYDLMECVKEGVTLYSLEEIKPDLEYLFKKIIEVSE